ncbi:metal-dependent amidase/aminoacylase/carboxypeptidase family protein [Bradyrhizobium sp. GM6.1]
MTTKTLSNNLLSSSAQGVVIELCHAMHYEPELSNDEWKTQQRETLERFRLTGAQAFYKTGVYVDIEGVASGPPRYVAVRGDINALPLQKTSDAFLKWMADVASRHHSRHRIATFWTSSSSESGGDRAGENGQASTKQKNQSS